jgi:peptidoglycan/xylan/chitin deacetylase (PgdA/CDA1 family)
MIALTFDDGPSAYTLQILSALERYGGRATFCVLGDLLEDGAAVVARARSLGCEVIGHSWDHKNLTKLTEAEIRAQILDTSRAIQSITGVAPNIYRPPYGAVNERVLRVSAELGFAVINWNVDPEDWKNRNPDMIYSAIMRDATDRSIILAHDTYSETAGAVTRAIRDLTAQGYQLVTVSELLHHTHGQIQAGEIYYSGNTVIGR